MALTTLADLKAMLNISSSDTTEDTVLNLLITQVGDMIQEWCGRTFGQANYTEYYVGNGQQEFALNQRPAMMVVQSGCTCTSGSPTITGLASTTNLINGMAVVSDDVTTVPSGATISSKTSNSVTLSANCTASGTHSIFFGLAVWLDEGAMWGQASSSSYTPFAAGTLLTPGSSYALEIDQTDGISSRSGLVYNVNGYWPEPFVYNVGLISPMLGPSNGNIKVSYTGGYGTVPTPMELACNLAIARIRNLKVYGEAVTAEKDEVYSYNLKAAAKAGVFAPEVTSILARYRNLAVG